MCGGGGSHYITALATSDVQYSITFPLKGKLLDPDKSLFNFFTTTPSLPL